MKTRRVTIQDIAHHAQTSAGTVSRVLNDSPNVSKAARERVLRAIEELHYRPSFSARHMRTGRSHIIGFITDEIATTPFATGVIKGAQYVAWQSEMLLLVVNSDRNPDIEQAAVEMMLERGVEGIIYAAWFHREVSPPKNLREVPAILVDCFVADRSLPSVVPDEYGGGYLAGELLVSKGHQRIAFINLESPAVPAAEGRLAGFKAALDARGLFDPELVLFGQGEAPHGYSSTHTLMKLPNPPTAIFCGNDRIAMGTYNALHELGLCIPQDVAVIGFDNQEVIAKFLRPGLSTIALPHYDMGYRAVQYLLEHRGERLEPLQMQLPCPYVERDSI